MAKIPRINKQFKQAQASGNAKQFLKTHKKFATNNAAKNAEAGNPLKLQGRYDQAVEAGNEDQFLKNHKVFATNQAARQPVEETPDDALPATDATAAVDDGSKETDATAVNTSQEDAANVLYPENNETGYAGALDSTQGADYMGDMEGSKLYNFQMDKGQKALDAKLAAMGLSGSGAEINQSVDLATRIGAEESERMREQGNVDRDAAMRANEFSGQYGLQNAQRLDTANQNNANRLADQQENSAMRGERGQDRNYNQMTGLLNMGLAQSPMPYAANASNAMAAYQQQLGSSMANYAGQMVPTSSGGGGGGGGSSAGSTPFVAPYPAYTGAASGMAGAVADGNNAIGQSNMYNNIFGGLF